MTASASPGKKLSLVLVTGLSGAGKNSILRALEDLGFETIDNPPLDTLEDPATRVERNLAIGIDARSRGFSADSVLSGPVRLRQDPNSPPAWSSPPPPTTFCSAATRKPAAATRSRNQARCGRYRAERELTEPLAHAAELIDTSNLALPRLRAIIEQNFGAGIPRHGDLPGLLRLSVRPPPEADLVFDARFLKNPFYDPILRPLAAWTPKSVPSSNRTLILQLISHISRALSNFYCHIRAGRKKICNNMYRMYRRTTQICGI